MKRFKVLAIMVAVIMLAGFAFFAYAETPSTLKPTVWRADHTFKFDVDFDGPVDFDDTANFDGAVTITSTLGVTGLITASTGGITDVTGGVTAGEIADVTRTVTFPLTGAYVDGMGPISGLTAVYPTSPSITAVDSIPKINWASGGVSPIAFSFVVPQDHTSSLAFRLLASSNTDTTPASWLIDWEVYVNHVDTAFDAAAFDQAAVTGSSSTPSTKNSEFIFTPDATAAADIASGDTVTVRFWPADTRLPGGPSPGGTTEVSSVQARYTAVQ